MNNYQKEFPNFEFIDRLGGGESGEVFSARDNALDRKVAIKIYNGYPPTDPLHIQDYQAQVRKIAALNHKNIAKIYFTGMLSDDTPYAIYEYVKGVNLTKYISEYKWEKLNVLGQIIKGMDYAHRKGIIHGDLHKDNILVKKKGTVKILDFFGQYCSQSPFNNENKMLKTGYGLIEDTALVSLLDKGIINKIKPLYSTQILWQLGYLQDRLDDYRNRIHVDDVAFTEYFIHDWTKAISAVPIFDIEKIREYITTPTDDESCMDVCACVKENIFFEYLKGYINSNIIKSNLKDRLFPLKGSENEINEIMDFYDKYKPIRLKNIFKENFEAL